jgi:TonB family protein
VAHDLSLSSSRFERMSPGGLILATLLHALVALALWWISPLKPVDRSEDPVEITVEQEVPAVTPQAPPPPPPPPPVEANPPPPPPVPQAPAVQETPSARMGLTPPVGTTMDSRAPLTADKPAASVETPTVEQPAKAGPATEVEQPEQKEAAQLEPPKEIVKVQPEEASKPEPAPEPEKPEPAREEQQQAALAPQPQPQPPVLEPSPPTLEQALPPLEAPPPPVPPPPPKPQPQPVPRAQTPPAAAQRPPAPQQQLPPSPLSHFSQRDSSAQPQQAARPAPSFTNPADVYGQRKAQEDYLWSVVRKISQHRYYPKSAREKSEEGLVVTLVTIARDGRLLNATINRSSGYPTLDNAVLEIIRQSAPYAPLPSDVPGEQHTFVLPLNYKRNDTQ